MRCAATCRTRASMSCRSRSATAETCNTCAPVCHAWRCLACGQHANTQTELRTHARGMRTHSHSLTQTHTHTLSLSLSLSLSLARALSHTHTRARTHAHTHTTRVRLSPIFRVRRYAGSTMVTALPLSIGNCKELLELYAVPDIPHYPLSPMPGQQQLKACVVKQPARIDAIVA
jgi:hypothetical protein